MFRPNERIGPYVLVQKIGRGAFGEVWLAEEKTAISSHRVALKLPNEDDFDIETIRQEAKLWEAVKGHPNILPIIKADVVDGQVYIASEFAPDGSLSKWLKFNGGKAPDIDAAHRMMNGIVSELAHLHSKGIIHRDLKPENILLQANTPRIADFGIARLTQSSTQSTSVTGTPSYMAPECFYGDRTEMTDIWAAGVLFHVLLSGKLPFPQPDQVSVMNAVLNGEPEIDPTIPEKYQEIVRTTLEKDLDRRFASASALLNALGGETLQINASNSSFTVPITSYDDAELQTVLVERTGPSADHGRPLIDFWKIGIASLAGLMLLVVMFWAGLTLFRSTPAADASASPIGQNTNIDPNARAVSPLDNHEILKAGEPANSNEIPDAHIKDTSPAMVPAEDGYAAWANGGTPLPGVPPPSTQDTVVTIPRYVPPSGQTVTIPEQTETTTAGIMFDSENNRCFIERTIVRCPWLGPEPKTTEVKKSVKPKEDSSDIILVPVPATTPKPATSPAIKDRQLERPPANKP